MSVQSVSDWKRPAALGYVFLAVNLGLVGWAACANLDSAVIAQGVVATASNRKTVEHLEGGIISEILVREGQRVDAGQRLFQLDGVQAQSSLQQIQQQLDSALAQEARLLAERDGADEISFPEELSSRGDQRNVALDVVDQTKQFAERRAALLGEIGLYRSKIESLKTEIAAITDEEAAANSQHTFIAQELADLRYLFGKNLIQKTRVLAIEREKSRLEGIMGRAVANRAKAKNEIDETDLQIRQIQIKFLAEVNKSIVETRQRLGDLREKVKVASDICTRLAILAPVAGIVQKLKVFTVGGVIRPGEPLLDIVPDNESLIVQAQVSPNDVHRLEVGMRAEVRFPAFRGVDLPILMGRLNSLSRDRLVDEQNKQQPPYFLAQVIGEDAPDAVRDRLTPGMEAEVIFSTGERTILDYLVRPLHDRMSSLYE
jgi:HlyD family type I secretion membrane fusion protein